MTDVCIQLQNVSKSYGDAYALQNFDLTVERGVFLTIIGSSGCGKTTALKLMNGLLTPDSGSVLVNGVDLSRTNLIALRRKMGYVIQGVGLFDHMTVGKNVAYVPSLSKSWTKTQAAHEVAELLETVGLPSDMAARYPRELSGGQRQRVGLARALAAKPDVLLMDEPFGAVDEITRRALQSQMLELRSKLDVTVVFVTHDIREALLLGSQVLVMDQGKRVQLDTPQGLIHYPATPFVKDLILAQSDMGVASHSS